MNCGLGNNGGSNTIIKSANSLKKLGNDVKIIDTGKNQNTWSKLEIDHLIIKDISQIPKYDIIIGTGFNTIFSTIKINEEICKNKLFWIRGWETWKFSEDDIVKKIMNNDIVKIVNSICLKNKLKKYNIDSYIIRPGNDLNLYKDLNIRNKSKIIIGGLYNLKHQKIKRMDWIFESVKVLKNKFNNIELWMMGNDKISNLGAIDKYYHSPNEKEKLNFYNNIDIWLAPTSQEGLHLCPQEAMLCGCLVIGTNAEMSGIQDYLINNETGIVSENNIQSFIDNCIKVVKEKNKYKIITNNGKNKIIELGDREKNMTEFLILVKNIFSII